MRNTPHSERNTAVVSRILPAKIYSYLPTLLRSRYDSSLFFLEQGLVELGYSFVHQCNIYMAFLQHLKETKYRIPRYLENAVVNMFWGKLIKCSVRNFSITTSLLTTCEQKNSNQVGISVGSWSRPRSDCNNGRVLNMRTTRTPWLANQNMYSNLLVRESRDVEQIHSPIVSTVKVIVCTDSHCT